MCNVYCCIVTILLQGLSILPVTNRYILCYLAACSGGIYPIVVNGALQEFPDNAAKAAGLQNFLQISLSFGASSLVAMWASKW